MVFRCVDVFSGYGGFSLAAEAAGFEVVMHCEYNPYCQAILRRHWPHVLVVERIQDIGSTVTAPDNITLLLGGPPCQAASISGQRKGVADFRWLWPEAIRIVGLLRPLYFVFENPAGILSLKPRGYEWIVGDLEAQGYEVGGFCYGAEATGAPHLRERVFIVGKLADSSEFATVKSQYQANTSTGAWGARAIPVSGGIRELGHPSTRRCCRVYGRGPGPFTADGHPRNVLAYSGSTGLSPMCTTQNVDKPRSSAISSSSSGNKLTQRDGVESGLGKPADGSTFRLDRPIHVAGKGTYQHPFEAPRICQSRPFRKDKLQAIGNGLVPSQAYALLKGIYDMLEAEFA